MLTQGLNRQIRRMCSFFGYKVVRLQRVRIINVTLGGLQAGPVAGARRPAEVRGLLPDKPGFQFLSLAVVPDRPLAVRRRGSRLAAQSRRLRAVDSDYDVKTRVTGLEQLQSRAIRAGLPRRHLRARAGRARPPLRARQGRDDHRSRPRQRHRAAERLRVPPPQPPRAARASALYVVDLASTNGTYVNDEPQPCASGRWSAAISCRSATRSSSTCRARTSRCSTTRSSSA